MSESVHRGRVNPDLYEMRELFIDWSKSELQRSSSKVVIIVQGKTPVRLALD